LESRDGREPKAQLRREDRHQPVDRRVVSGGYQIAFHGGDGAPWSVGTLESRRIGYPGGEWRVLLVERYTVVRKFVPLLVRTIDFGATAEAAAVPRRAA
jgi:hypothetical protein